MPGDFWIDLAQTLVAGAIVAAVALPTGLAAWASVRRNAKPLLPCLQPFRCPWGCFEVVVAFLVVSIIIPSTLASALSRSGTFASVLFHKLPPVEASAAVAGMPTAIGVQEQTETTDLLMRLWAGVLALPLQLSLLFTASRILYPALRFRTRPTLAAQVVLAVITWAFLTPLVLGVHAVVNMLFTFLGWQPDVHQLTRLAGRFFIDSVLLVFQACVAAPVIEEVLFRGVILAWVIGGRKPLPVPDVPIRIRPWLVVLAALAFAAISVREGAIVYSGRDGATIFISLLIVGLPLVDYRFRTKRRTVSAVYSSAVLFAAVHSSIWPSPIPLFLLGLGLGWLAVRTRSVFAPIIVHGLFNAIASVIVLRSAG